MGNNGAQLPNEKISQIKPKTCNFAHPDITSKWSWPETVRKVGTLKKWFFSAASFASCDVCKSKIHTLVYQCLNKDHSSPLLFPYFFPPKNLNQSLPKHLWEGIQQSTQCYPSLLRQLTGSRNNSSKRQENKNNPRDKVLSETSLCRGLKHLMWLHSRKPYSKLETTQLPWKSLSVIYEDMSCRYHNLQNKWTVAHSTCIKFTHVNTEGEQTVRSDMSQNNRDCKLDAGQLVLSVQLQRSNLLRWHSFTGFDHQPNTFQGQ